jgi:hypothetical protein
MPCRTGLADGTRLRRQRFWCGEMFRYPKLIAPLQIDLAIGLGRYLFGGSTNPVGPGLLVTPTSCAATEPR